MSDQSWLVRMASRTPDAAFEISVPAEITGALAGGTIAPRISRREALQVPAVKRGRDLIAGTLGGLPHQLRDKQREEVPTARGLTLLEQIDPDIPNNVVLAATYEDLIFEGESWWRVTATNFEGYPIKAEHLQPGVVHVDANGRIWVNGQVVPDGQMIRFYSPNPAVLVHGARAIRTCLTLDTTAQGYAETPVPLGVLRPKDGTHPNENPEQIEQLLDKWEQGGRRRVWRYLGAALELQQIQFNAEQIQLADQRNHAVLEIARLMGVDPEDLGVSTTSRTYQNAEQRRQDLIDFTMSPYMRAVEQRLSMADVTPRGYTVKVNLDSFLRSDTKGRMETYAIGEPLGLYPPERLAVLEGIPKVVKPKVPMPPALPPSNGSSGIIAPAQEEANGRTAR